VVRRLLQALFLLKMGWKRGGQGRNRIALHSLAHPSSGHRA
jgi:hypothetical protein